MRYNPLYWIGWLFGVTMGAVVAGLEHGYDFMRQPKGKKNV